MNTATRNAGLRQILLERRRELEDDVQNRIRGRRIDQSDDVGDHIDKSDAQIRGDIERALVQMRTAALSRISEALVRLEAGTYGRCLTCRGDIAKRRLRALPFAVRCQACEAKREKAQQNTRKVALTRHEPSLFPMSPGR